jgi:hypothetical protein
MFLPAKWTCRLQTDGALQFFPVGIIHGYTMPWMQGIIVGGENFFFYRTCEIKFHDIYLSLFMVLFFFEALPQGQPTLQQKS